VTRREDFAQHWAVFSVVQQDVATFVSIFISDFSLVELRSGTRFTSFPSP
jgi:hypothetical protein